MSNTGFGWSAMPNRRVMIGSIAGALVAGALFGLVIGIVAPQSSGDGIAAAAVGPTGTPTRPASTTGTPPATSKSATPSPSKVKFKTRTRTDAPIPPDFIQQPFADHSLVLYKLQAIDYGDRNNIRLTVLPGRLLTGAQAAQHYADRGEPPRDVAVESADNQEPFDLLLSPDAALWGQSVLGGDGQNVNVRRFGLDEFLGTVDGVLGQGRHPAVWVKRSLGSTGRAIYVAEQFPA